MFRRLTLNFCKLILVLIIVLFLYFIVQIWILKFVYIILYSFQYLYKIFSSSISYIVNIYFGIETSYWTEGFINNFRTVSTVKHILSEYNYTKLWINYYLYSKYLYGTYCVNTAEHYILDWKPFWYFGVYDFNNPKYAVIIDYFDKNGLVSEIPTIQLVDYFWGSYRGRVTEGDFTLMPETFYYKMFKRFLKRALRWNYYFSAQFLYLPSLYNIEILINEYIVVSIHHLWLWISLFVFKYMHYTSLVTIFLWILLFRVVINLNFLYNYLSLYVSNYSSNYFNFNVLLLCLFLFFCSLHSLKISYLLYMLVFLFALVYSSQLAIFSGSLSSLQKSVILYIGIFIRKYIVSLKSSLKRKSKKNRQKQYNKSLSFIVWFKIYSFLVLVHKLFFRYSSSNYYATYVLCKKIKYFQRRGISLDLWDTYETPLLINPQYYSDIYLPCALKGSRGGLWLRTTHKEYAKHLMYENTDALRFFHHHDTLKYFIWEPQFEYGLHFYNQRELVFLNADNLFNNLFVGVKRVYTNSFSKAYVIGGVSHYDIHRNRLNTFDANSFLIKSFGAHVVRWISLWLYWLYMYITPFVIKFIYEFYYYFYNQLSYLSFFITNFFRWRTEIMFYDTDPDYISYLRFLEFYKLFSYKYFDYYLPKRAPYFFGDTTRVGQIYFLKELDGWILRYKFFELDKTGYFMANGGLQQALLAVLSLLVIKMAKWSLLFYKHVPIEFLLFTVISFISKIWFFHKFFGFLDNYIYKCVHASIWAKKKFVFNSGHVRFHHHFLRSRWKLNKRITPQMSHGRHLHSRKSHYDLHNFF